MQKLIFPFAIFSFMVTVYLIQSGAPLSVHALSIGTLALGYLVPSCAASFTPSYKHRIYISVVFVIAAMLLWDGVSHTVIVKAEPFSILLYTPWLYAVGLVVLVSICLGMSWLSTRLTRRSIGC